MPDSGKILYFDTALTPSPQSPVPTEPTFEIDPASKDVLADLIYAMQACGQDPVTQLAGYLITEDPTYLPECGRARSLARHIGRDKLLETLIEMYMKDHPSEAPASPCL
ncbi:MAG: IreB family regulatory phosphoprotein [Clostridia bacterium]|nr:IreB family regulatory phosphoprotein [Clostridia bacterium]